MSGSVHSETLRRDVQAYLRVPPTLQERALAEFADTAGPSDDTDWQALYAAESA